MRVDQGLQQVTGQVLGHAEQRGGRGGRDGRPLPEAEQAEGHARPELSSRSGRVAKLTWKLARTARSPTFSSSSSRCWSRSRFAIDRMDQPLRVVSRAAQIRIASGKPEQASSSSAVASGSDAARSSPTILANSVSASSSSSTLRSSSLVLARSGIRLRVVISTALAEVPGSSGRT